ncbi:MAG: hypothetical protein K2P03_12580, partial [Lachnospiraceae bacterium]|nr:hypothetical protein [Lachnospiraceae bacterium]
MLQEGIDGKYLAEKRVREQVEKLFSIQDMSDTMEVIEKVDEFYNQLVDTSFEKEHGDLQKVLSVGAEDLKAFDWQDFLNETAMEASMEELISQANSGLLPEEDAEERRRRAGQILINEEAAQKMYSYIELHYGKSYLSELEQERQNRRICRGVHADCKLYFTDGIIHNLSIMQISGPARLLGISCSGFGLKKKMGG